MPIDGEIARYMTLQLHILHLDIIQLYYSCNTRMIDLLNLQDPNEIANGKYELIVFIAEKENEITAKTLEYNKILQDLNQLLNS